MKLPNNEGDRITNGHLLSLNKAFNTRFGLHIIELLAKGPNNRVLFSTSLQQTLLVKTIPI